MAAQVVRRITDYAGLVAAGLDTMVVGPAPWEERDRHAAVHRLWDSRRSPEPGEEGQRVYILKRLPSGLVTAYGRGYALLGAVALTGRLTAVERWEALRASIFCTETWEQYNGCHDGTAEPVLGDCIWLDLRGAQ